MRDDNFTPEEIEDAMSFFPRAGQPPLREDEVAAKIMLYNPFLRASDDVDKLIIRMATFDSIGPVDGAKKPTMGSVCCFLKDNPLIDAKRVVSGMLEQLKTSDGNLDFSGPEIFTEEEQKIFNEWEMEYGSPCRGYQKRNSTGYREMPRRNGSKREGGATDTPSTPSPSSSTHEPFELEPSATATPPPPSQKKQKIRENKAKVVGQGVIDEFTRVIFKVDLVSIGNDDFDRLFNALKAATDLCPTDARKRIYPKELDEVDACLLAMSRIEGSCARRTDDSEMAADFALAVVGACLLLVGRKMPSTHAIPIPDILWEEDELSISDVKKYEAKDNRISYKDALEKHAKLLAKAGMMGTEAEHFSENNFAVVEGTIPIWLLDLIEAVVTEKCDVSEGKNSRAENLKKHPVFQYLVNGKSTKDTNRKLIDCGEDWILYNLIAFPVSRKLEVLGFLKTADSSKSRIAKVVTYIESIVGKNAGEPREKRDQSWHTDFSSTLAEYFGEEFGISVIVGATDGSEVHLIARTYGLESRNELRELVMNGNVKKVVLPRGSCLVMGPGLRHKGIGYDARNVRLFLAFLVGKSVGASFGETHGLDDVADELCFVGFVQKVLDWLGRT